MAASPFAPLEPESERKRPNYPAGEKSQPDPVIRHVQFGHFSPARTQWVTPANTMWSNAEESPDKLYNKEWNKLNRIEKWNKWLFWVTWVLTGLLYSNRQLGKIISKINMPFLTFKLSTLYGLSEPSTTLSMRYKLQLSPSYRRQWDQAM